MNEQKGNQYKKPDSEPSEQHGEGYNKIKPASDDEIVQGAHQEDQLEKLQPNPDTAGKQESQPPSQIDDGGDRSQDMPPQIDKQ